MQNQNENQQDNHKNIYLAILVAAGIVVLAIIFFSVTKSKKQPMAQPSPALQNNKVVNSQKKPNAASTQPSNIQTLSDQTISVQILNLDRQKNLLAVRMPEGHIKEITLDESISYLSGLENKNNSQVITLTEFKNIVSQNINTGQQTINSANPEIILQINFKTFKTLTNEEVPASDISSITVMPVNYELTDEQKQQIEAQIKNLQGMLEKSNSN